MPTKAERYEALYPATGCSDAQKEERMERIDFKTEARTNQRTGRNRGVVIPGGNPWIESLPSSRGR